MRVRLENTARKKMIIDTAVELISKNGWWRTTLTGIAQACPAPTSISTIYYHFKNRAGFAQAMLDDARVAKKIKEDIRTAL